MKKKRKKKEGRIILTVLILAFSAVLFRMIGLYISEGIINTNYKDPEIHGEYYRGTIYDRNNEILAMDSVGYVIRINTKSLTGISRAASIISGYTNMSALELEGLLAGGREVIGIESNLNASSLEEFLTLIEKERLERTVWVEKILERAYTTNGHGMEVIGRVDGMMNGISGAELYFNDILSPPLVLEDGIVRGMDVRLSLDIGMQYIADFVLSSYDTGRSLLCVIGTENGQLYALSVKGFSGKEIRQALMYAVAEDFTPSLLAQENAAVEIGDTATGPFEEDGLEGFILRLGNHIIISICNSRDVAERIAEEAGEVMVQRGKIRADLT